MRLTEFSVQRFQFTLVMFILLAVMGWHAFQQIPRGEDPVFPIPVVTVVAVYPGADPLDMEKLVTDPIEDALNETDDIKRIWSESEDGLAVVRVEYDWTKDAEKKYDEALREINSARGKLPPDLASLKVEKASPGLVSIVQYALVGPSASPRQLRESADDLKDRLEQVAGVRSVEIHGLPEPELQVAVDLDRLARFGIPLTQLVDTLKGENTVIPGGAIETGTRRFNLRTSGGYDSPDEVADTVVAGDGGKVVRLRDVAAVRWDYEEARYLTRYNGKRAVFITVSQKDDMNIFKVRDAIVAEADSFRATLSPDLRLELGFDQSRNVDDRLSRLGLDFMIAVGLVMVTLLPLGLRAAGVVMVSIPLSMAIGIAMLYFAGFSLNQLSIAGFVLALGLLVDDSIVVTENIERFLRSGYARREAAIAATRQITLAVLGCTATLLFAFLPLFMLPEGAGKFILSMAAAVSFTVIASLLVSLTMIPFLASRFLSEHDDAGGNRLLQAVMRGIHLVYRPLLQRALARPRTTLALAGGLFAGTLALVPLIGFSLFPVADVPQFMITVDTPDGSAVGETDRAVKFVEQTLLARPEIKYVFSNSGRGNPRVFYNVFPRETRANVGDVYAELHAYDPVRTPALFDDLRRVFANYAGARIIVKPFENGPPIDAPIAIRLTGPDLETLRTLAGRVETLVKATPGTRDVTNPVRLARTDIDLGIDTAKASLLGVPTASIDRTARLAIAGERIGNFREADGDEYAITVRLPRAGEHQDLSALKDIHVQSLSGAALPLAQVATPKLVTAPNVIPRYKRQRAVTVTAYAASGYNIEKVTDAILAQMAKEPLPAGYRYAAAGQREARQDSFAGLNTAAMIAIFGILAVLILEFGNFRSTVIVAGVIPLGIIGGLLALLLSGYSLSFMAMVGFIALVGIEIKNSILLVDFTHQLREEGTPLLEAIQQAGEVRFLPILLTSLTAIGGLLPLALQGSALYSPLAWVIIGGLVSSTFLARLVTPVMYLLLAPPMATAEAGGEARAGRGEKA